MSGRVQLKSCVSVIVRLYELDLYYRNELYSLSKNTNVNEMDVPLLEQPQFQPQSGFQRWNGDTVLGANGRVLRFIALAFICFLTFGSYYVVR